MFQLHELGFAIGSPIRRSIEKDQGALRSKQASETAGLAVLILQLEVRHLASLRRTVFARHENTCSHETKRGYFQGFEHASIVAESSLGYGRKCHVKES